MDSDDTLESAVSEPAGQQLKRARERKGLSVSDVAEAQHLRPAVIQAIEDCDYEQVGTELFLKGYVRTYARQVGLDADAVIAKLDQELEPLRQEKVQAEELNPLVDIERRKRQKRRIGKLLFFLVVIAIVAFVGLRFLEEMNAPSGPEESNGQDATSESIESEDGSETAQVADDTGNTESTEGVESTEPPEAEESAAPEDNDGPEVNASEADTDSAEAGSLADETSVTAEDRDDATSPTEPREIPLVTGVESDSSDRAPEEERAAPDDEVNAGSVPVVTSSTEPVFEESAQPGAAAGNARLEMSFSAECWVQITDSAGNRLVGALQRDGDQIDVSGRLPIEVIVGAVDAIDSIRFDGEPVDMSDFRVVNNRAEFTLDI